MKYISCSIFLITTLKIWTIKDWQWQPCCCFLLSFFLLVYFIGGKTATRRTVYEGFAFSAPLFAHRVFCFLSATVLFPAVYMIFNSFMLPSEVTQYYASAMQYDGTYAMLHFIPDVFSLESFYQVFLRRPDFLVKFWNSLLMCAGILLFQGIRQHYWRICICEIFLSIQASDLFCPDFADDDALAGNISSQLYCFKFFEYNR